MPRYRIVIDTEAKYIQDVDAETEAEAIDLAGQMIRHQIAQPVVVGFTKTEVIRYREPGEN